MKIIAGWVIALAMLAGTGTAIALNVKPQWTSERCVGLSCWPDSQVAKYRPAQRTTAPSSHQSGVLGEPEMASQADRIDRSRKADRIRVVTLLRRFACARLSQSYLPKSRSDFSATFTTIAFGNSSLRWLEINT
jgi:hypothetical protein